MRIKWHGTTPRKSIDPLAMHIGKQLFRCRQKHQLTMRDVAGKCGLSTTFICQIENGLSVPSARTLWQLSQFFGVPLGYWLRGYKETTNE